MSSSSGSGTASGSMLCPDPGKPVLDGYDTAQGADHPNESLRQGAWPDLEVGQAVATATAPASIASSRDRVSNADIGSAVPYLVPEIQRLLRRARRAPAAGAYVPRLAPGVEQFGEYQGSGLTDATYLVRNPGGKVVQVSTLLHLVLSGIDGSRTISEIAARVTADFGRTVSAGNVEYLLVNKLGPLGLLAVGEGAEAADALAGQDQAQALLALKLHRTLVPAAAVQHIANLFRPLFNPVVVVAVLVGLIASDVWLIRGGRLVSALTYVLFNPLLMLLVLGLAVVSLLFHECGHAAACRYGGARPGIIGVGFYVIWPAFFTNVTDTYRLGRAGRIRTDVGGVYFNAVFALVLVDAYLATGYAPLVAALFLVHMEMIQQLMPSLRLDGYFILADLIGVPDLFRRIVPTLRSMIPGRSADPGVGGLKLRARVGLTAWVLFVIPMLGGQLTLIILDGPALVRTFVRSVDAQAHDVAAAFGRIDIADGLLSTVSLVLLVLPMVGLGYILLSIGRRAVRSVIKLQPPASRAPGAVRGRGPPHRGRAGRSLGVPADRPRRGLATASRGLRRRVAPADGAPVWARQAVPPGWSRGRRAHAGQRARVRRADQPGRRLRRRERRPGEIRHRREPGDRLADPVLLRQPGVQRPEGRDRTDLGHGPAGKAAVRHGHIRARAGR